MAPPSADAVTGAEEIGAHGSSWDVRRQLRAETTKRVATELRAVALQATVTRQDEKLGNLESVRSLEGDALEEAAQQARVKIQQLLARLDASGPLPGVTRPAPPALPGPAVVPVGRPRKRTAQKIEELRSSRPAAGRSPEKSRDDRLEELRRVQAKKQTREQTVARLQAVQAFNDAYDRSAARTDPAGEATPTSAPTARRQVQAGTVAAPAAGKRVEGKPGESQIASELEERAQSARSAEQVAFRPAPPAAKPGSPPPPPPQSLPETQQFLQAASGSGRQELLQLVELFPETKQFLRMVDTNDRISELFSRQVGGKSEPDELKKGAASQNDSEVSARPLTAAGPAAELRPVPQELANRRAHELPPPPPTGETAAHFAEWRVPSSTGGTGSAAREVMPQAERRREAGRGGSGRRELCPPPPAGEVAAYFAEWGVPAVAAAAAAAPVPGLQEVALRKLTGDHRRVEPSARELGQRELCPPRPTGEVAAYFAEWGVVVPVDAAAAAPRRGLSVRRTPF